MKRGGFTLIEMVITLVISSILTVGTMLALRGIYEKSIRAKHTSLLSLDSQIIADRIATMLYDRIPSSSIGYDPKLNIYKSIYNIDDTDSMKIFEWFGEDVNNKNSNAYSGFIDLDASNSTTISINSPTWNMSLANAQDRAFIFAGSYDMGEDIEGLNFSNLFGWHNIGTQDNLFRITAVAGDNITLNKKPNKIYEKYYLADQAYAIARGEDLNKTIFSANCSGIDFPNKVDNFNNSLFIFYGYYPWKGETFCADPNSNGNRNGSVALLSENVSAFNVLITPSEELKFSITMEGAIRGSDRNVTVSKQKIIL